MKFCCFWTNSGQNDWNDRILEVFSSPCVKRTDVFLPLSFVYNHVIRTNGQNCHHLLSKNCWKMDLLTFDFLSIWMFFVFHPKMKTTAKISHLFRHILFLFLFLVCPLRFVNHFVPNKVLIIKSKQIEGKKNSSCSETSMICNEATVWSYKWRWKYEPLFYLLLDSVLHHLRRCHPPF